MTNRRVTVSREELQFHVLQASVLSGPNVGVYFNIETPHQWVLVYGSLGGLPILIHAHVF